LNKLNMLEMAELADEKRRDLTRRSGLDTLGLELQLETQRINSLPPSDLPGCCLVALARWASGLGSGLRCLMELSFGLSQRPSGPGPLADETLPGICSWPTLVQICGLLGTEDMLQEENSSASPLAFHISPSRCLQHVLQAIRAEAGLAQNVQFSLDELHLGLRSLELQAHSEGRGRWLQAIGGRELLRFRMEGIPVLASEAENSASEEPAKVLASVLTNGSSRHMQPQPPPNFDGCRAMLLFMVRTLRDEVQSIQTYGPYAVLGVDCDAPDALIKRYYRDLCLKYHPDKGGDTALFQSLQQAYDQIVDDRKKGLQPCKPRKRATRSQPPPRAATTERRHENRGSRADTSKDEKMTSPSRQRSTEQPRCQETGAAEEILQQIQCLSHGLQEGSKKAASAAEDAICSAATLREDASHEDRGDWQEWSNRLLKALDDLTSVSKSSAEAASKVSQRVAAAGILGSDGDQAEVLMTVSLHCADVSSLAADASVACAGLTREIAVAAAQMEEEDKQGASPSLIEAADRVATVANEASNVVQAAAYAAAAGVEATSAALRRSCAQATAATAQSTCKMAKAETDAGSVPDQQRGTHSEKGDDPSMDRRSTSNADRSHAQAPIPEAPDVGKPFRQPAAPAGQEFRGAASQEAPKSTRNEAGTSGTSGASAPSPSMGARARADSYRQQWSEAFQELETLNNEALQLQGQLHRLLLASPLLLPQVSHQQKHKLFAVMSELLLEVSRKFILGQIKVGELPELLAGRPTLALCETLAGAVRLAALVDLQMLSDVLQNQLLPRLIRAQPEQRAALEHALTQTSERLQAWVLGR
jgi:curved DNA-binding protein CbpA